MKTATGIELSKALELLAVDFPQSALSERKGSGGKLSSISPAYEIERLNQVFGMCGFGWRYSFTDFKEYPGDGKIQMVIVAKVTLEYYAYAPENGIDKDGWSSPITAIGQGTVHQGMSVGDAHKSAVTDGLTKAASMIGVGQSVFKGEQSHSDRSTGAPPGSQPTRETKQTAAQKRADTQSKQTGYRDNPGWTDCEGFSQAGNDMVEIQAEFKLAPKSGRSLIFIIAGKDVFIPVSNIERYSSSAVVCTEWIAYKKVESGDIPENLVVRISNEQDGDPDQDHYDESNPPPIGDNEAPF